MGRGIFDWKWCLTVDALPALPVGLYREVAAVFGMMLIWNSCLDKVV